MIDYVIGIDLGGTAAKIGIFETSGRLIEKWQIATDTRDSGNYILQNLAQTIREHMNSLLLDNHAIKGIGIGVPGIVLECGLVAASVNLGWNNKNVTEELALLLNMPVKILNDANAAALGEMWQGSGTGYKNLVMLTLGTGIGGGVVVDGKIVTGLFGAAGEIGHMPLVFDETQICNCGRKGCLEQVASATGIRTQAIRLLSTTNQTSILRNIDDIDARMVCDAAKEGDILALQVIERTGRYLGLALASISSILDPEVFIIGGGVSNAGQFLINIITKHYKEQVLYLSKNTPIRLASLGNDAGIYGSAKSIL